MNWKSALSFDVAFQLAGSGRIGGDVCHLRFVPPHSALDELSVGHEKVTFKGLEKLFSRVDPQA